MSAERLKALVEQGNLINLNIVSDSLGNLLNEISQMLVEQQKQIRDLNKQLLEKMEKKEFVEFRDQWRTDRDMILRSFPNFEATLAKMSKDNDNKFERMQQYIDASSDQLLVSIETKIDSKVGANDSDIQLTNHRLDLLEQKFKSPQQQQAMKIDVDNLKKRILKCESDIAVVGQPKVDEKMLNALKEELEAKIEELSKNMVLKSQGDEEEQGSDECDEDATETDDDQNYFKVDELENNLGSLTNKVEEINRNLLIKIEQKAEIVLVERMFEKFRTLLAQLRDDVETVNKRSSNFVVKKDFEMLATSFHNNHVKEESQNAGPIKTQLLTKSKVQKVSGDGSPPTDLPILLVPRRQ